MYTEKQSHFFSREFFKIRALRSGFSVFVFWICPFSLWYSIASVPPLVPLCPMSPKSHYAPTCLCALRALCHYSPFVPTPLSSYLPCRPMPLPVCHYVHYIILGKTILHYILSMYTEKKVWKNCASFKRGRFGHIWPIWPFFYGPPPFVNLFLIIIILYHRSFKK